MKNAREFVNYKNTLARHNIVMLATVGSTVLGLESAEKSDIDEMGICVEQPNQLLGFAPFEHDTYRTAEDRTGKFDSPSEPGDIDLTVYGLRKFARLSLGGNPNLITLLYLPKDMCSVYTPLASELQGLALEFASKEVVKAFLGYLKAQRLRLQGNRGGMDVNRRELVEQFGYDTKYAMHMFRLAMQGYDFSRQKQLQFPLRSELIVELRKVRNGSYTLNDVLSKVEQYEDATLDVLAGNNLPDKPNYGKIEAWLLDVYKREWYENKTTPQQQGITSDQAGENQRAGKTNRQEIELDIPF